jgi:hypothetical protein
MGTRLQRNWVASTRSHLRNLFETLLGIHIARMIDEVKIIGGRLRKWKGGNQPCDNLHPGLDDVSTTSPVHQQDAPPPLHSSSGHTTGCNSLCRFSNRQRSFQLLSFWRVNRTVIIIQRKKTPKMLARSALSNIARRAVQAARPVAGELRGNIRPYPPLTAAKGAGGGVRPPPNGRIRPVFITSRLVLRF